MALYKNYVIQLIELFCGLQIQDGYLERHEQVFTTFVCAI